MDSWIRKSVFEYHEVFENGRTYHGFSSGKGVFHDAEPQHYLADQVFKVLKDRTVPSLLLTALSCGLRSFLASALPNLTALNATDSSCYDFQTIFSNYSALQLLFRSGQWDKLDDVRLFMQDFLLDIDVWSSFGFESLYEDNVLSASHWQDMQNWSTERCIDDLEELIDTDDEDDSEDGDSTSALEARATGVQESDKWLWLAAREGHMAEIYRHLKQRTRLVDATCLTIALDRGHLDVFWLLFHFGAAVQGNPKRWMAGPIFAAAKFGCLEAVQSLVHQANRQNGPQLARLCFTPLRGAIEGGHEAIVSYLVSLGEGGDDAIVSYLISLGADSKSLPNWRSIMVRAATEDRLSVLQWIRFQGKSLDSATMPAAAENGHHRIVKYLLEIEATGKHSYDARCALSWSIKRNDLSLFNLLLDYGVDPEPYSSWYSAISFYGRRHMMNPMDFAVSLERVHMLRRLAQTCSPLRPSHREDLLLRTRGLNRAVEMKQIIENLPLRSDPISDFSTAALSFDFTYPKSLPYSQEYFTSGRRATLKKGVSTSKDSDHCPLLARLKAKERLATRQRLRENFLRMHTEFLERSSSLDVSYELSMFVQHIGTAQRVWKKGFDSIRRLLNNRPPSSLQEVFACVQLSCSMRTTLDEPAFVENSEADGEFLKDLDRWRLVVPNDDQSVYDEITRVIWGKSNEMDPGNIDWLQEQELLEYFQKMMTSLISETHSSWVVPDACCEVGGHRLSAIHEQFDVQTDASDECKRGRAPSEDEHSSPENNGNHGGILEEWKPASPVLILLTATTIFVVIVTFFLVLRFHGIETAPPPFATSLKIRRSLRHYCYILSLYLGVSNSTRPPQVESETLINSSCPHSQYSSSNQVDVVPQEGTEYGFSSLSPSSLSTEVFTLQQTPSNSKSSSSGAPTRKQCSSCLKTFSTISNLNKHKKTDCKFGKMTRYTCRNMGCRQEFTRESYRAVHEKERCFVRRLPRVGKQGTI